VVELGQRLPIELAARRQAPRGLELTHRLCRLGGERVVLGAGIKAGHLEGALEERHRALLGALRQGALLHSLLHQLAAEPITLRYALRRHSGIPGFPVTFSFSSIEYRRTG
jgi:hypothetical protein